MQNEEDDELKIADQFYKLQDSSSGSSTKTEATSSTSSDVRLNPLEFVQYHLRGGGSGRTRDEGLENCCFNTYLRWTRVKEKILDIYIKETLLVEVGLAILIAYCFPEFGVKYLYPDISAHWICVIVIFLISGLSLNFDELSEAASNWKFNSYVTIYNFFIISFTINFVARYFYRNEIISEDLMKGMIICSCLSTPTNMMVVIATASKGDEASSLFIAMAMNLLGIFVTPLLLFIYMGEDADIDFVKTFRTISLRVVLPVIIGLIIKTFNIAGVALFVSENKTIFQKIRQRALVFIIFTTFCSTFLTPHDSSGGQIFLMALSQVMLLITAMAISWVSLFVIFNRHPKLRVAGLFASTMKTAAMGVPLTSAIYEDHPKLGLLTLPLLIWYPAQLVIGTFLSSRLCRFVDYKLEKYEKERQLRSTDLSDHRCDLLDETC